MRRVEELRSLSPEERRKRIQELRLEIIRLRGLFKAGRPPDNVMALRNARKELARLLTIEREEQLKRERGSRR